MKRLALLAAFGLFLVAAPANAQVSVYGGGGPAFPIGDDLDGVDPGIQLLGGITFDLSDRVSLYGEGQWGTHNDDSVDEGVDATVKPSALMAGLLIGLAADEDAPISPYIFGGLGLQTVDVEAESQGVGVNIDDTGFGYQVGAGLGFELGSLPMFLEGRYQAASYDDFGEFGEGDLDFSIFSIILGFSFDLSGDN